ncbi:MAG: sugar ABC transporter permease, partial [Alphaproteobacteria bacterium]
MPYLLLTPQMAIIAIFFLWPAAEAIRSSFYLEDPFFGNATFVGLDNYIDALTASDYQRTAFFTGLFVLVVALVSLGAG